MTKLSEELLSKLDGESPIKAWMKAHIDYPHDEWCLIWPFADTAGATIQFSKEKINVFRFM